MHKADCIVVVEVRERNHADASVAMLGGRYGSGRRERWRHHKDKGLFYIKRSIRVNTM